MRLASGKQSSKRYHNVTQIVAENGGPDAVRALTHPAGNETQHDGSDCRMEDDTGMKLSIHHNEAIKTSEEYCSDDEPPAELRPS